MKWHFNSCLYLSVFFLSNIFIQCLYAKEWDVITFADALSEKDYQKLGGCSSEQQYEKMRLKIFKNALIVCRANSPQDIIVDAIPELEPHPTRKFKDLPVLIFKKVHCVSSDRDTSPEEIATVDLLLKMFPKTSTNVEKCVANSSLDKLPVDVLNLIARDLSGKDIVSLSRVSKILKEKTDRMQKRMKFVLYRSPKFRYNKVPPEIFLSYFNSSFGQNIKNIEFGENFSIDNELLNQLPRGLVRLKLWKDREILNVLRPENFPNLVSLELQEGRVLPLDRLLLFPQLAYLGGSNNTISLSTHQIVALPGLTEGIGRKIKSLHLSSDIENPARGEEFVTVINSLPNLKILGFSYDNRLTSAQIELLRPNLNIETLIYPSYALAGDATCVNLLRKFPNVKNLNNFTNINLVDFENSLKSLVKLEKLALHWDSGLNGTDADAFWKRILPNLTSLKVLQLRILPKNYQDLIVLSKIPNLEKLQIDLVRNEDCKKFYQLLADSGSRIKELNIRENVCIQDINDPAFLSLLKLQDLKILYWYLNTNNKDFEKGKATISRMTNGRVQLVAAQPDFFEDEIE